MSINNYVHNAFTRLDNQLGREQNPALIEFYTILALTKGSETTMQDVHDAWSLHTSIDSPDHPSIRPFDHLPESIQEMDRRFMEAIHEVAKEVTR